MGVFKNRTDLQSLREAARIAGAVCDALIEAAQPGVSSLELEALANRLLQQNRSTAPFKQFDGFGHAICLSLNDEVVNGPPSRERVLKENDLVSIAVGSCYRGLHGKAARTCYLGEPSADIQRLVEGTKAVFPAVLEASRTTTSLRSILERIPAVAEQFGLTLIERNAGAGIGKQLHEFPYVPNHPKDLVEPVTLVPGTALTFMPMLSLGASGQWVTHEDGWTQVTQDGALSAHFAETCLMTDGGFEILSRP